jgi:thiamine biosynthesis lipoprotein
VAKEAARAAFDRIEHLNSILSDYDLDSELSRLSRSSGQGKKVRVSEELWFVLSRAQALAESSNGAFDITVGPAVNLWRRARRNQQLPEKERLDAALKRIGFRNVQLDRADRAVELLLPNMRLDLGGIAKGYAVDEAMKVLRDRGIVHALVGGDGDIAVSAPPPGREGWRIAIANFDSKSAPTNAFLLLKNRAVSTSGDLSQRLEIDGRRYSHIIDPRTGIGLTDHSMVTVIAPDSITADSLATTISVLGPEAGSKLLEPIPHLAGRIVRQPGKEVEVYESREFRNYLDSSVKKDTQGSPAGLLNDP